jgi:hypothetical protein
VKAADLKIRGVRSSDRKALRGFTCSTGEPWEDLVQDQIRGPLPDRYLSSPPYFDGRLLLGFAPSGDLVVVGAHHIEPAMVPDVGYAEVIAVTLAARGMLVELPESAPVSLGHFMLLTSSIVSGSPTSAPTLIRIWSSAGASCLEADQLRARCGVAPRTTSCRRVRRE